MKATTTVILFLLIFFLFSQPTWAVGIGIETDGQKTTVTDPNNNKAVYTDNGVGNGGQIEYKYYYRDVWHTTYVNVSEKQKQEILDQAKKGQKIDQKYLPLLLHFKSDGVLVGNKKVGDPINKGERFVEAWRVLLALGRSEDRQRNFYQEEEKKTREFVESDGSKTRSKVTKEEKETREVISEGIKKENGNLKGFIFFVGCLLSAIIIIRIRRR